MSKNYLFLIFAIACTSPNTKWVIDMNSNQNGQGGYHANPDFNPETADPNYNFYKNKYDSPNINQIYSNNPNLNKEPELNNQLANNQSVVPQQIDDLKVEPPKQEVAKVVPPLAKEKTTKNDSLDRIKYKNIEILDEKEIEKNDADKDSESLKKNENPKNEKPIVRKTGDAIPSGIWIQLGIFNVKSNADKCSLTFRKKFPDIKLRTYKYKEQNVVIAGPYSSETKARTDVKKIRKVTCFDDAFISNK